MSKVAVIGAGAFGTALSKVLAEKNHEVSLWSFTEEVANQINNENENSDFLPGVKLPDSINCITDIHKCATDQDFLIIATPSIFVINTLKQLLSVPNIIEGETLIATIAKGFVDGKQGSSFIVDAMENYLPGTYKGNVVYISGPSHAEEVGRGLITGLISACPNARNAIAFRELFSSETIKIYSSLDVIGVQTCGSVKNVIAIGFGILDAIKEQGSSTVGDNTESLLFAMGLNEIQNVGMAMGATHPETFTSIAGVGDLDVTCRSHHGRNRRFGREVVLKDLLNQFSDIDDLIDNIDKIGYLPEGVIALKHVISLNKSLKIKIPLIDSIYRILNKEVAPEDEFNSFLR